MKKNLLFIFSFLFLSIITKSGCNDKAALEYLNNGNKALTGKYDYKLAIENFSVACKLYDAEIKCETPEEFQRKAQAYIGLAFTYHCVGQNNLRDEFMKKACETLELPNSTMSHAGAKDFTDTSKFNGAAAAYFMADGYRFYIYYEQAKKEGKNLDLQASILKMAKVSFKKTIEIYEQINKTCKSEEDKQTELAMNSSNAMQGLGTTFEFLGKTTQESVKNLEMIKKYFDKSTKAFSQCLELRKKLYNDNHLNVARTMHKLARSLVAMENILEKYQDKEKNELHCLAKQYYKNAIEIFERNKIDHNHPKFKELETDYKEFKENRVTTYNFM